MAFFMFLFSLRRFSKIKLIAAIVISTSTIASAQEPLLKKKQAKVTMDAMANYYASGKNIKQGLFQIWNVEVPKVRVQGGFNNNKRSGNWVFFDYQGKIIIRHNYTLNKLITYDKENLKNLEIKVFDGSDVLTNPDVRPPLVLSTFEIYHSMLLEKVRKRFPAAHQNRKIIEMTITAFVDSSGQATYNFAYNFNEQPYKVFFKVKNDLFQLDWLPAKFENKTYDSEASFTVKYWAGPSVSRSGRPYRTILKLPS
jgi:hypothetical protein